MGMKQKVLAGALIHEPHLLMLDEPLTGLDAAAARQVKDILTERVRAGATVILFEQGLRVSGRRRGPTGSSWEVLTPTFCRRGRKVG